MSKENKFSQQIKGLKASTGFVVKTETDRQLVCRAAATLKRFGQIDFDIVTRKTDNGFKVVAI